MWHSMFICSWDLSLLFERAGWEGKGKSVLQEKNFCKIIILRPENDISGPIPTYGTLSLHSPRNEPTTSGSEDHYHLHLTTQAIVAKVGTNVFVIIILLIGSRLPTSKILIYSYLYTELCSKTLISNWPYAQMKQYFMRNYSVDALKTSSKGKK